jgi:hypothetical protein
VAIGIIAGGCGTGTPPLQLSGGSVGDTINQPPGDPTIQSKHFVVDASGGGLAGSMTIDKMFWGRRVDVYDSKTTLGNDGLPEVGDLQQKDMVIGENIQSDLTDFKLSTNPVTSITTVQILHPYITNPPTGQPAGGIAYHNAFQKLELGLVQITPKGATPADLPPFTLVPRNSTLVIKFTDLVSTPSVTVQNVRALTGNPPILPFEARIAIDQNHGDLADFNGDGVLEFHTTRVLVECTVSELEAASSNPPLPVNAIGLPASVTTSLPNVLVRIPTHVDASVGQTSILVNCSGHPVAFGNDGPNDPSSPTGDVVRACRSGNSTDVHNGFLLDMELPRVIGVQQVGLNAPSAQDGLPNDGTNFRMVFVTPVCMSALSPLKIGDVVRQPSTNVFAQITDLAPASATENVIIVGPNPTADKKYLYHVIPVTPGTSPVLSVGAGELSTAFDPSLDSVPACFARFSDIGSPPNQAVRTDSSVTVRFSEPMDPASMSPFDTQTITRVQSNPTAKQFVVGGITPSSDFKEFSFVHDAAHGGFPFNHAAGAATQYFLNLASGPTGPTDLAGNQLAFGLPQVLFTIDPSAGAQQNSGVVFRFNSLAENPNGLDMHVPPSLPDIRGQFLIDIPNGLLRPRTVIRFSAAADRTQPVPSIMVPFTPGVQTPLSGLGSKLQALWRYCDVGFSLQDETTTNVDVQNIDWTPVGGSAIADHYTRFEIGLAHSLYLPDEWAPPPNNFVVYSSSGLVLNYAANLLDPTNDPLRIVHNRNLGYNLNPSDLFSSEHGVPMMPFPLNRTIPIDQYQYYTWRDTALQSVGAPFGDGVDLHIVLQATGTGTLHVYPAGQVPTIGLPLLMQFSCFPDDAALGLNSFDVSIAANTSAKPNFRAFSTGGVVGSTVHIKDPDLETVADGGFNPNSTPPGAATLPADNTFYIGQLDLVVRVSRAFTIWINTSELPVGSLSFAPPIVQPTSDQQPLGTQVALAFRGATGISDNPTGNMGSNAVQSDAGTLDAYGEPLPPAPGGQPQATITFLNNSKKWLANASQLTGARFFQVRVSFISNATTNLSPILSGLGFAYTL